MYLCIYLCIYLSVYLFIYLSIPCWNPECTMVNISKANVKTINVLIVLTQTLLSSLKSPVKINDKLYIQNQIKPSLQCRLSFCSSSILKMA